MRDSEAFGIEEYLRAPPFGRGRGIYLRWRNILGQWSSLGIEGDPSGSPAPRQRLGNKPTDDLNNNRKTIAILIIRKPTLDIIGQRRL